MMKICNSTISTLNVFKTASHRPLIAIANMFRATNVSHHSRGIHHNVDAPFGKPDPNPKVTRQTHVEDPYDHISNSNVNKKHEEDDQENDFAGYAKDTGKSALETAFDVGKTVAEGMEKTFSTVKETTEKVKDTVVGNKDAEKPTNDVSNDNYINRGDVDKHVEDLRKAGGYDQRRSY